MNITYRGHTPEEYGAMVASIPVYTPSVKNRNIQVIPNHLGDAVESNYGRSDGKFDVLFHATPNNWETVRRALLKWLSGTGKLVMSDADDAYYEVKDVTVTEDITRDRNATYGRLRAIFTVTPYEFLNSGDTGITSFPIVNNAMRSMPIYKIVGTGSGTLTVNGHTMTYTVDGTLNIDTRRFRTTDGNGAGADNKVNGDYAGLYLQSGSNSISATVGTLTVYPKWGYEK